MYLHTHSTSFTKILSAYYPGSGGRWWLKRHETYSLLHPRRRRSFFYRSCSILCQSFAEKKACVAYPTLASHPVPGPHQNNVLGVMATTASLRSPGQKASSPSKKLPSGFTVSEAASIRANYELETRSRRAELQAQMEEALSNLRSRFEAELDRVPPCIHSLSVKDFLSRWKGDLVKAAEDTLRLQLQHEHDKNTAQERAETEHRSPKKRLDISLILGNLWLNTPA